MDQGDSDSYSRTWRLLKAHHLGSMSLEHKRALILRACGLRDDEAAAVEGVSSSTFRRRLHVATCHIGMCLPEETSLTSDLRGAWVGLHEDCLGISLLDTDTAPNAN